MIRKETVGITNLKFHAKKEALFSQGSHLKEALFSQHHQKQRKKSHILY